MVRMRRLGAARDAPWRWAAVGTIRTSVLLLLSTSPPRGLHTADASVAEVATRPALVALLRLRANTLASCDSTAPGMLRRRFGFRFAEGFEEPF